MDDPVGGVLGRRQASHPRLPRGLVAELALLAKDAKHPTPRVRLENLGCPVLRPMVRRDDEAHAGAQVIRELLVENVFLVPDEQGHDESHLSATTRRFVRAGRERATHGSTTRASTQEFVDGDTGPRLSGRSTFPEVVQYRGSAICIEQVVSQSVPAAARSPEARRAHPTVGRGSRGACAASAPLYEKLTSHRVKRVQMLEDRIVALEARFWPPVVRRLSRIVQKEHRQTLSVSPYAGPMAVNTARDLGRRVVPLAVRRPVGIGLYHFRVWATRTLEQSLGRVPLLASREFIYGERFYATVDPMQEVLYGRFVDALFRLAVPVVGGGHRMWDGIHAVEVSRARGPGAGCRGKSCGHTTR